MIDMTKWNELVQEIATKASEPGALTAMLTQATDAFGENHGELLQIQEENERLKNENHSLIKYNADLFRQVSDQKKREYGGKEQKETEPEERATTITIKELFKEGE